MDSLKVERDDWKWQRGVSSLSVEYTPGEAETEDGVLTWFEEVAPEDDERGNGLYTHSTQTRTEFLRKGPQSRPPVAVVASLIAFFQVPEPSWFDPYRLLVATGAGDLAAVKEMLAQGVPHDMPLNGMTPLCEAVLGKNLPLAEMLFAAGVEVNWHFPGSDETILMILATYAPDASWEPLAERIVAQGADLEARQKWGDTALMDAAYAANRLPGLVPLLLRAGADVNACSVHGYTALMKSVMHRYAPVTAAQQLLAAGADVNLRDKEGWSALMWAISNSLVTCVPVLLEAGADVHIVSTPTQKYRDPKSVLQLAIDYANPEIVAMIQKAVAGE